MRCDCCDRALNDYESSLKSLVTGEYLNSCRKCLKDLDIIAIGNGAFDRDNAVEGDEPEEVVVENDADDNTI